VREHYGALGKNLPRINQSDRVCGIVTNGAIRLGAGWYRGRAEQGGLVILSAIALWDYRERKPVAHGNNAAKPACDFSAAVAVGAFRLFVISLEEGLR
jgi:hypothetical protein